MIPVAMAVLLAAGSGAPGVPAAGPPATAPARPPPGGTRPKASKTVAGPLIGCWQNDKDPENFIRFEAQRDLCVLRQAAVVGVLELLNQLGRVVHVRQMTDVADAPAA